MRQRGSYGCSRCPPPTAAMRLAKYLAHAGVASRRARRGADRRRAGAASAARSSPIPPATSTRASAWRVDGRRARRPRAARASTRSTSRSASSPPRATRTGARPSSSLVARARAAPVPGRAPRRRQHRPDPAHQRRRAREPPHPPALRGAEDLPRAARRRPGRRARRCARCARASRSRTAAPRPRACAALGAPASSS